LRRFDVGAPKILIAENDEAIFLIFVAFDDLLPCNFLPRLLVEMFVSDRREVALVEHCEARFLALLGGMQFDRNVHQSKGYGALPESTRHRYPFAAFGKKSSGTQASCHARAASCGTSQTRKAAHGMRISTSSLTEFSVPCNSDVGGALRSTQRTANALCRDGLDVLA
jgi:hypothetical protein